MMRGMRRQKRPIPVKSILSAPFRAVAAPFRGLSRFRAGRKEKKMTKMARLTQERFERMVPSLQDEVKRTRKRLLD